MPAPEVNRMSAGQVVGGKRWYGDAIGLKLAQRPLQTIEVLSVGQHGARNLPPDSRTLTALPGTLTVIRRDAADRRPRK